MRTNDTLAMASNTRKRKSTRPEHIGGAGGTPTGNCPAQPRTYRPVHGHGGGGRAVVDVAAQTRVLQTGHALAAGVRHGLPGETTHAHTHTCTHTWVKQDHTYNGRLRSSRAKRTDPTGEN